MRRADPASLDLPAAFVLPHSGNLQIAYTTNKTRPAAVFSGNGKRVLKTGAVVNTEDRSLC